MLRVQCLPRVARPGKPNRRCIFLALCVLVAFACWVHWFIAPTSGLLQVQQEPTLPVTSVLHPLTPDQPALNSDIAFSTKSFGELFNQYEESFPQHGKSEPGKHYRVENTYLLSRPDNRDDGTVLIICVFNDAKSWGKNRNVTDFLELVKSFDYQNPYTRISQGPTNKGGRCSEQVQGANKTPRKDREDCPVQ
ncbi:hypothetical protein PR001_g9090 [Phytophthora rubi]|uniref:Uncharacterized protein n=1 Tax=Phytophthora rubi TaxID=129364 RepID=A0A6A3MXJ8_9STRA|nr:hypothetical protein PR001_g9090 [Phytophthora rubi]